MLVCELLSCQVEFKPSDLLFILRQGDLPESWEESNFQQTSLALESPPDVITLYRNALSKIYQLIYHNYYTAQENKPYFQF